MEGIINNMLLFKNNMLLFKNNMLLISYCWKFLWEEKALMEQDKSG